MNPLEKVERKGARRAPSIAVDELLRAVDAGAPLVVVDVRGAEDPTAARIVGRRPLLTVAIPYLEIFDDPVAVATRLPRRRLVVVACATDRSSAFVADVLRAAGLDAWALEGGMEAYDAHVEVARVPLAPEDAQRFAIWQLHRRAKGCLSYVVVAMDHASDWELGRSVYSESRARS